MMADFVTKMAKQAALRLSQFRPALFHLSAVASGSAIVPPVIMPGHQFGAGRIRRIGQEFERQTVDRVLGAGLERQFPSKQAIEQPALGEFDVRPGGKMRRLGAVGIVSLCRQATHKGGKNRHQPCGRSSNSRPGGSPRRCRPLDAKGKRGRASSQAPWRLTRRYHQLCRTARRCCLTLTTPAKGPTTLVAPQRASG